MNITKEDLKTRTKKFNMAVINACELLPGNASGCETAKQLIQSAGSDRANYGAACRAKSASDVIYKIEVVIEETDESMY